MTVKELKEALEGVPDDAEVFVYGESVLEHYDSRTIATVSIDGQGEVFLNI